MKKNKVFVGTNNTAGNAYFISEALKRNGIKAISFSYAKHPFGYKSDINGFLYKSANVRRIKKVFINKITIKQIWKIQRIVAFIKYLFKCDIYFFISPHTFFKSHADLYILRLFKKKIAFFFPGCPERNPLDKINLSDGGFCSFCNDLNLQNYCLCNNKLKKEKKIKLFDKYSDIIFSHRDTAGYLTHKEKIRKLYVISIPSNKPDLLKKFDDPNQIIRIAHFPSNRLLKGTDNIENVIKDISGYPIEYTSERIPNDEVLNQLEKTHILIDQFASSHGLLSIEALSRGCIVICRLAQWFKEDYPGIPIISCEPDEIKNTIIQLISNREQMKKMAFNSFGYYMKYHTPEAVGRYYKQMLGLK